MKRPHSAIGKIPRIPEVPRVMLVARWRKGNPDLSALHFLDNVVENVCFFKQVIEYKEMSFVIRHNQIDHLPRLWVLDINFVEDHCKHFLGDFKLLKIDVPVTYFLEQRGHLGGFKQAHRIFKFCRAHGSCGSALAAISAFTTL